jgi:hypothetical protein
MPFLGALNRGKRARAGEYDPPPAPVLSLEHKAQAQRWDLQTMVHHLQEIREEITQDKGSGPAFGLKREDYSSSDSGLA